MLRSFAVITVALLGVTLLWLLFGWQPKPVDSGAHQRLGLTARPAGGDFGLNAAEGRFRLSDLSGKVVLLYFGYRACPDICPTNLAIISLALRSLSPDEQEQVRVVFVSVDPERDTPEQLADYVGHFYPRMIGVTGSDEAIAAAASVYGAAYQRSVDSDSAMGYAVDHSAYSYLIDGSGRLVQVLEHATPAEEIAESLRRELARLPDLP